MLDPEQTEHIGDATTGYFDDLEVQLLIIAGSYLLAADMTPQGALSSIPRMQLDIDTVIRRTQGDLPAIASTEASLLMESAADDIAYAVANPAQSARITEAARTRALMTTERLTGHLRTMSTGLPGEARSLYTRKATEMLASVATGVKDSDWARKDAVVSLAREGITTVPYTTASGKTINTRVDVALRRVCHTEMAQSQIEQQLENAEILDAEFVEVSSTTNARESHADWQGRVYQLKGRGKYPNFHDACHVGDPVEGIGGYNCGHTFGIYIEGRERRYDPDPTKGTGYTAEEVRKLTTQQRSVERDIRDLKRERDVLGGLGMDTKDVRNRLGAKTAQLDRLVSDNDKVLKKDPGRTNVHTVSFKRDGITTSQPLSELAKGRARPQLEALDRIDGSGFILTDHVRDRVRERKVPYTAIEDAIYRPLDIKPIKADSEGRLSYKLVGADATVAINPGNGNIVTVYRTRSSTRRKLLDAQP